MEVHGSSILFGFGFGSLRASCRLSDLLLVGSGSRGQAGYEVLGVMKSNIGYIGSH